MGEGGAEGAAFAAELLLLISKPGTKIFERLLIRKPGSSTPTSLSSPDRSIESRIGTWSTAEPIKTFVGHLLQVFTFHSYLATSVSALATGDPRQSKPERDRVRQIKTK